MIGYFRDPVWQFIGALLGFIALIVAVFVYLRQRSLKALNYQVLSFTPILSVKEENQGDIQIFYKDNLIKNLYLITLRISNTGNVPISSKDYEKPISIFFGQDSRIFSTEIFKVYPESLTLDSSLEENKLTLAPLLLNSGDYLEIKCLVNNPNREKVLVHGRVVGVRDIKEIRSNPIRYLGWSLIGVTIMVLALIIHAVFFFDLSNFNEFIVEFVRKWPFYILSIIGIILSFTGLVLFTRKERKPLLRFFKMMFKSIFTKD